MPELFIPQKGIIKQSFISSGTQASNPNTSQIPADNTVPQITEGINYSPLNTTFQPLRNDTEITVQAILHGSVTASTNKIIVALFKDSGPNAVAVDYQRQGVANGDQLYPLILTYKEASDGASRSYTVRFGTHTTNTAWINRSFAPPLFGNRVMSSMRVTESL